MHASSPFSNYAIHFNLKLVSQELAWLPRTKLP